MADHLGAELSFKISDSLRQISHPLNVTVNYKFSNFEPIHADKHIYVHDERLKLMCTRINMNNTLEKQRFFVDAEKLVVVVVVVFVTGGRNSEV